MRYISVFKPVNKRSQNPNNRTCLQRARKKIINLCLRHNDLPILPAWKNGMKNVKTHDTIFVQYS